MLNTTRSVPRYSRLDSSKDAHPHRLVVLQHLLEVTSQICFGIDRRIECVPRFGLNLAGRLQSLGEPGQVSTSAQESDEEEDNYSDGAAADPDSPNSRAPSAAGAPAIYDPAGTGRVALPLDHIATYPLSAAS